jgi:hypothetical protein
MMFSYKMKNPIPTKPLTEGEPYCSACLQHVDSCGCLIVAEAHPELWGSLRNLKESRIGNRNSRKRSA